MYNLNMPNGVQSSFNQPVPIPATDPADDPKVCISVNASWIPYICGALFQLVQPAAWASSDPSAVSTVITAATELMERFGEAGGCLQLRWSDADCAIEQSTDDGATWTAIDGWDLSGVQGCVMAGLQIQIDAGGNLQWSIDGGSTWTNVDGWSPAAPANPGGVSNDQLACNVATHLALNIIQGALARAVNAFDDSLSAGLAASGIIALIPAFGPEIALTIDAAIGITYLIYTTGSIGDYRTASTDPVLAHDLQCAIYNTIKTDGYVTGANYSAVISAISGIGYTPSDVQTAIDNFMSSLGLNGLLAAQAVGGVVAGDCSLCNASTTAIAFHQSGSGLMTLVSDLGLGSGDWTIGMWIQARPGGVGNVDGGIYQSGNAQSPSGAYLSIEHDGVTTNHMGINGSDGSSGNNLQLSVGYSGTAHHHMVYTRNGTTVSQYEDGTFGGNASFPSGSYQISGTRNTYFGGAFWNWGSGGVYKYLDGMLWGIAVYVGTALNATQITAWYNNGGGMPPVTPTHFWACDEGAGSTVHDTVGTNHGTLTGTTSWETHS